MKYLGLFGSGSDSKALDYCHLRLHSSSNALTSTLMMPITPDANHAKASSLTT